MKLVRKKEGKRIQAYCLGERNPVIDELIKAGKIRRLDDHIHWRVFSKEATKGELAVSGDYIKVDSSGTPYPNTRKFFLENHRHLGGDDYEQIPRQLSAWSREDRMCPEIRFLMEKKGLVLDENNEEAYFSAPLWGDMLTAAKDAVIVFYELKYGSDGEITDVDFNFVARGEFDRTYDVLRG